MKTRIGYVSNSSSSSFILLYNDESKLVIKGRKRGSGSFDFTISDMIDIIEHSQNYSSDCTEILANGIENVKSYLTEKDSFGYSNYDEEYSSGILKKIDKNKDKYHEAMIVKIEYDDKIVRKMIDMFVKSGEMLNLDESEA